VKKNAAILNWWEMVRFFPSHHLNALELALCTKRPNEVAKTTIFKKKFATNLILKIISISWHQEMLIQELQQSAEYLSDPSNGGPTISFPAFFRRKIFPLSTSDHSPYGNFSKEKSPSCSFLHTSCSDPNHSG
jgi:hypothetical protein